MKTLPSVTFHLGGHEYSLSQEDYILWVSILHLNLKTLKMEILHSSYSCSYCLLNALLCSNLHPPTQVFACLWLIRSALNMCKADILNLITMTFLCVSSNPRFKGMSASSPSVAWMYRPLQVPSGFWEPTSLLATTQSLTAATIE